MYEIIRGTLYHTIVMLPFLFGAYLLIEFVEHKATPKFHSILAHSNRFGAFWGALLGCVPQCGFSVLASNLYAGRVISLGTLVAVFLSTSDEAIPVLLSSPGSFQTVFQLLAYKLVIAVAAGFIIDRFTKKSFKKEVESHGAIHEMCSSCDCKHGIVRAAAKHTLQIFAFLVLISFVLNYALNLIGEEKLAEILLLDSIFQPLLAAVIGLIPNCVASVILTRLYVEGAVSFGAVIAGLSVNAGMGWLVLFKMNRDMKENFKILGLVGGIAVVAGTLIQLLGIS